MTIYKIIDNFISFASPKKKTTQVLHFLPQYIILGFISVMFLFVYFQEMGSFLWSATKYAENTINSADVVLEKKSETLEY